MKTLLITGANGFIGRNLCRRLLDHGFVVRGGVRRTEAMCALLPGIRPVLIPDFDSVFDCQLALSGVHTVIHLASRDHSVGDGHNDELPLFRKTNVEGTRRLTESCVKAGVCRLIYVSSIKAVGEGAPTDYLETTPPQPETAYGRSRLEAEAVLRKTAQGRLETVILRPPLVYGPGVSKSFFRLMQIVSRGFPLPLGWIHNARSMVYVGNLVDAIITSLFCERAPGGLFHVADNETLSTPQLVLELACLMNRRTWLIPVPPRALRIAGRVLGKHEEVERLVGSLTVSISVIQDVLGWKPPFSAVEGLRETVAWFQDLAEPFSGRLTPCLPVNRAA